MNKFIKISITAIVLTTTQLTLPAKAQIPLYYDCVSGIEDLVNEIRKHPHVAPRNVPSISGIATDDKNSVECRNDILKKYVINGHTYKYVYDRTVVERGEEMHMYYLTIIDSHEDISQKPLATIEYE